MLIFYNTIAKKNKKIITNIIEKKDVLWYYIYSKKRGKVNG